MRKIRTASTTTKLFNLADDPSESNDLSSVYTSIRDSLLTKLRTYQLTMLDPIDDEQDDAACDPSKHSGYWGPWDD